MLLHSPAFVLSLVSEIILTPIQNWRKNDNVLFNIYVTGSMLYDSANFDLLTTTSV
jgi:hypothetical protein